MGSGPFGRAEVTGSGLARFCFVFVCFRVSVVAVSTLALVRRPARELFPVFLGLGRKYVPLHYFSKEKKKKNRRLFFSL